MLHQQGFAPSCPFLCIVFYVGTLFIAQLRRPSAALAKMQLQNSRDIIGGPGLLPLLGLFTCLKRLELFDTEFKCYTHVCNAKLLRASLNCAEGWKTLHAKLHGLSGDDLCGFAFQAWVSKPEHTICRLVSMQRLHRQGNSQRHGARYCEMWRSPNVAAVVVAQAIVCFGVGPVVCAHRSVFSFWV